MLDVHARLREARKTEEGDPIEPVAEAIADEARLLCFDEMQVNNPADAMILSRLFAQLLERKASRSSPPPTARPRDLYKDGLNRELFLPFIALIEQRMLVVPVDGAVDYRLQRLHGVETWHVPNGPAATAALSEAFFRLTDYPVEDRAKVPSEELDVGGGRTLHVPKSLKGVAVFSFKRLCGENARRRRLSGHRAAFSHRDHRRHSSHDPRDAQRGGALRDPHRRALRPPRQVARQRRRRARGALPAAATAASNLHAPSAASRKCAAPIILPRGMA